MTRSSIGRPPRSRLHATRTFLKSLFRLFEKISPDSAIDTGARGAGPAMAERRKAQSSTVCAIGPITASESQAFGEGHAGTGPGVGRQPTALQQLQGLRRAAATVGPSAKGSM